LVHASVSATSMSLEQSRCTPISASELRQMCLATGMPSSSLGMESVRWISTPLCVPRRSTGYPSSDRPLWQPALMAIRIGFIGAGLIANWHREMLQTGGADVVWSGVYDIDRTRAHTFSVATGAPVRDSEDEVLDNCDAVYICTWTSAHRHCVEAAAERGVAVFCEKPLSVDLDGALAMAAAAERAGIINQVGLVLRFSPAMNWLRHLVTNLDGGRI